MRPEPAYYEVPVAIGPTTIHGDDILKSRDARGRGLEFVDLKRTPHHRRESMELFGIQKGREAVLAGYSRVCFRPSITLAGESADPGVKPEELDVMYSGALQGITLERLAEKDLYAKIQVFQIEQRR